MDDDRAAEEIRAELDAADERISENADGTLIVRLISPIMVGGAEHTRVTVGHLRVRHVRAARGAPNALETYAEQLVSPAGALDELASDADYVAVLRAAERALGKYLRAGRPSSPS